MNLKLENKLQQIYNEKQNKLLPSIIKTGEVVFGIRGNYTTDATATRFQILNGYTAYVKGSKITGFMPNNGTLSYDPTTEVQNIPEGYTTGGTINAVTSNIDSNIQAGNIKSGINILGITGNLIELNGTNLDVALSNTNQSITPNSPYNGFTVVNIPAVNASIDSNITSDNIKVGVNILNISGTFTSDATATSDYIANGYTAYVGGNKLTGVANIIKTYNSLNEMYNDSTVIADHSYGLEIKNDLSYTDITYNIQEGCQCLNILNSFTNTANMNRSLLIGDASFDHDFDFYNSGISINSTNAFITIIGENNECLLDAQYTSLDGVTYNLSSISGTCLEDNNTKFYCNLCNVQTVRFQGDIIPTYYNDFDCFWKPLLKVDNGSYVAALYKYDGINWNKLMDVDEPISPSNFNIAYNTVNQIKGY